MLGNVYDSYSHDAFTESSLELLFRCAFAFHYPINAIHSRQRDVFLDPVGPAYLVVVALRSRSGGRLGRLEIS